jgi:hypothetical protein
MTYARIPLQFRYFLLNVTKRAKFTELLKGCRLFLQGKVKVKGKAVPLQAWSVPEGSRKLRLPDFMTTAQDVGKVVSLTHRPPLPPRKYTWYSFLLQAESTPGP